MPHEVVLADRMLQGRLRRAAGPGLRVFLGVVLGTRPPPCERRAWRGGGGLAPVLVLCVLEGLERVGGLASDPLRKMQPPWSGWGAASLPAAVIARLEVPVSEHVRVAVR